MASTQGIRAGRAFVELFAADGNLVRGLRRASAKLKAFGEGVRGIGMKMAGLAGAVLGWADGNIDGTAWSRQSGIVLVKHIWKKFLFCA